MDYEDWFILLSDLRKSETTEQLIQPNMGLLRIVYSQPNLGSNSGP